MSPPARPKLIDCWWSSCLTRLSTVALSIVQESGSELVSKVGIHVLLRTVEVGKATGGCSSKTCPTSGVKCSSTARNGLRSHSWDRPARRSGRGSGPGWRWREARHERRRASRGCGTPSGQLLEERGTRLAKKMQEEDGRGVADAPVTVLYLLQKCTVRFCSRSKTVTALKFS